MNIMKIINTTDGKFIGVNVDLDEPIVLSGSVFNADKTEPLINGVTRVSNSNYSIDLVPDNGKNYFAQFARNRLQSAD